METSNAMTPTNSVDFLHGFLGAFTMILISELGDKTFFIAAIMAMRHARLTVFLGAMAANGLMTIFSAFLGYATTVIPAHLTLLLSSVLFAMFGVKMLKDAWEMSPDEAEEEYEEAEEELKKHDEEYKKQHVGSVSRVFAQAFSLTFVAEWGDRSQIATVLFGARQSTVGVILGGTIGHALCTGLAVLGGRFIAQRISVRTVTLLGGIVFLVFAIFALLMLFD